MKNSLTITLLFLSLIGCGVKGDPQAPLAPVELGRGEPTYQKATENIQIPTQIENARDPEDKDWEEEPDEDLMAPKTAPKSTPKPTPARKKAG